MQTNDAPSQDTIDALAMVRDLAMATVPEIADTDSAMRAVRALCYSHNRP